MPSAKPGIAKKTPKSQQKQNVTPKAGNKPKRSPSQISRTDDLLSSSKHWRSLVVGDELLLGSTEGGFMGLEVLDDATILSDINKKLSPAEDAVSPSKTQGPSEPTQPKASKSKRGAADDDLIGGAKKKRKRAADDGEEDVAALKRRMAKLEAENKKLKKDKKKEKKMEKDKEKKERKAKQTRGDASGGEADGAVDDDQVTRVDVRLWDGYQLHPKILDAISRLGFTEPTAVQRECLLPAINGRCDIIGAAQTGSGKTLAFGLPILHHLLCERDAESSEWDSEAAAEPGDVNAGMEDVSDGGEEDGSGKGTPGDQAAAAAASRKLRALILAPTRELAMQVCSHLQAVAKPCGVWVVPIVGGISQLKQERMLRKQPEVVVATPGRLWDLLRGGNAHLSDLSGLSFFVIDEADHMVAQGHFKELSEILDLVPFTSRADSSAGRGKAGSKDQSPSKGGGKGKKNSRAGASDEVPVEGELPDPQHNAKRQLIQVFVFSATLTLPAQLRKRLRQGGGGASGSSQLHSLVDKIPLRSRPKIVDLTSERKLGDKVHEAYVQCPDELRDEYLYYILACHPGRTLVFVNAISSVRRLSAIFKLLDLPVFPLHANMQQRQRLKYLDKFKESDNGVMIASDVAARGLDIKDVRCVIHYQLPASPDVYVHRSGRTARAEAEGLSIALVTPKDWGRFSALLRAFDREVPAEFPVDSNLIPGVHRRVRLAVRLDDILRKKRKERVETDWARRTADQLGIELSDDQDGSGDDTNPRKRSKTPTRGADGSAAAAELSAELQALLVEPLTPKYSAKFFTGGAASAFVKKSVSGGDGDTPGDELGKAALAVSKAVRCMNRVAQAQQAGSAAPPATGQHQKHKKAKASSKQGNGTNHAAAVAGGARPGGKAARPASLMTSRMDALNAALAKHKSKKEGKKSRLVVIPRSFGRDASGPDALEALKAKAAADPKP